MPKLGRPYNECARDRGFQFSGCDFEARAYKGSGTVPPPYVGEPCGGQRGRVDTEFASMQEHRRTPVAGRFGPAPSGWNLREGHKLVTQSTRHRYRQPMAQTLREREEEQRGSGYVHLPWHSTMSALPGLTASAACSSMLAAAVSVLDKGHAIARDAAAAASAAPVPVSMIQAMDLMIAIIAAHAPEIGAGALCDWKPESPRPRVALPSKSVILNRPAGLSAGLFYSGLEGPSFAELLAFAAHPWGGAVLLQLPLSSGRARDVRSSQEQPHSTDKWFVVLCGADDAGNAVVWDPATFRHDLEVPVRGRQLSVHDMRTRIRPNLLESRWQSASPGDAAALLVAIPPLLRRPCVMDVHEY
mmetsp:Transcript_20032/g.36159  ORF Transcript_20032/g.36159 Transcript_20032/m.36159 type:complete len:358 (-) Transcript_20032:60-1133(-)